MYICEYEILANFNLAVAQADHQTAKFLHHLLNEEAEYKKDAPRAEAIFKMHMANMAER